MKAEFVTKGFEKTESMDDFLRGYADELTSTYLKNEKDVHLRIAVDEDSHRMEGRKPHFFCEVQLKTASSKKYLKTHKSAGEFHMAVNGAIRAMKRVLQKKSDRRHDMKSSPGDRKIPAA